MKKFITRTGKDLVLKNNIICLWGDNIPTIFETLFAQLSQSIENRLVVYSTRIVFREDVPNLMEYIIKDDEAYINGLLYEWTLKAHEIHEDVTVFVNMDCTPYLPMYVKWAQNLKHVTFIVWGNPDYHKYFKSQIGLMRACKSVSVDYNHDTYFLEAPDVRYSGMSNINLVRDEIGRPVEWDYPVNLKYNDLIPLAYPTLQCMGTPALNIHTVRNTLIQFVDDRDDFYMHAFIKRMTEAMNKLNDGYTNFSCTVDMCEWLDTEDPVLIDTRFPADETAKIIGIKPGVCCLFLGNYYEADTYTYYTRLIQELQELDKRFIVIVSAPATHVPEAWSTLFYSKFACKENNAHGGLLLECTNCDNGDEHFFVHVDVDPVRQNPSLYNRDESVEIPNSSDLAAIFNQPTPKIELPEDGLVHQTDAPKAELPDDTSIITLQLKRDGHPTKHRALIQVYNGTMEIVRQDGNREIIDFSATQNPMITL